MLWFGIGAASRLDPRFNDLFVYFGLGVNACVLVDFLARRGPASRNPSDWLLVATIAGLALFPVLHQWPIVAVSSENLDHGAMWALIAEAAPADWLPWCSRRLLGVALAAMATSASSAAGLALLTLRGPADGSVLLGARIEAALGLLGAAVVLGLHIMVAIERCPASSCG